LFVFSSILRGIGRVIYMDDLRTTRPASERKFRHGIGEGVLSGVIAGLIVWYYAEQDRLPVSAAMIILLSLLVPLLFFPVLHISRKDWRLVLANITGLLLLAGLGIAYMVMVWVLLSLYPPVAG